MKREKRQAESKFRKSRLEVHKQLFEESCATYNSLLESTKCSYYRQKIENSNTKQLFRMIDGFFTVRSPVIPTHDSLAQLLENFNAFFIQRIHDFRRELDRVPKVATCSLMTDKEAHQINLSKFSQVSSTMINHVIKALSTKSCPLDP